MTIDGGRAKNCGRSHGRKSAAKPITASPNLSRATLLFLVRTPSPVPGRQAPGLRVVRVVFALYAESANANDLWIVPVDGDRKPRTFLATNFNEGEGAFAPDGRWIAYQSNESGRMEVYVRPVNGAGKWQISEGGGGYPRWSGDGRRLFFRDGDGIMAVTITVVGDSIEVGRAQRALKGSFRCGPEGFSVGALTVADYDVSRDGSHFVMFPLDTKTAARAEHLTFVLNWFTELRRLLPSKN
jgi:hypothetical protein